MEDRAIRPNISDVLGRFQEITDGVGPHSLATIVYRLSLVPHFVLLPSSFGYIGLTILPSGLEKGVTPTLFTNRCRVVVSVCHTIYRAYIIR